MFPDRCAIIHNKRRCSNPPEFVVSVTSDNDEYMVGVTCATHRDDVSKKVADLQLHNRIPKGVIKFVKLHPVGTDCIRADPDDRIQLDPFE